MTTLSQPKTNPAGEPIIYELSTRGVWEGKFRTRLTVREFPDFATGEPQSIGGDDSAPTPMELLVAALDGCLAVVVETVAGELGLPLRSIELDSQAALDLRGFGGVVGVSPHFTYVNTQISIGIEGAADELATLRNEVERRCPALNLLKDAGVAVTVDWNVI